MPFAEISVDGAVLGAIGLLIATVLGALGKQYTNILKTRAESRKSEAEAEKTRASIALSEIEARRSAEESIAKLKFEQDRQARHDTNNDMSLLNRTFREIIEKNTTVNAKLRADCEAAILQVQEQAKRAVAECEAREEKINDRCTKLEVKTARLMDYLQSLYAAAAKGSKHLPSPPDFDADGTAPHTPLPDTLERPRKQERHHD